MPESHRQKLYFHPAAKKDYQNLPAPIQDDAGHNLDRVQQGLQPECKFGYLSGIGSGVQELKIPYDTNTYRIVYVVKLSAGIFVLDAFNKKSPTGNKLSKNIQERISSRYEDAKEYSRQLSQS
ncbi:type II toxin-antitoxin system RelE/ParE family toxin [Longibacter sp.]|uniref:type II toxin-antitoxin system RelE/ParE family toxin n=1 Tax=Longibacter sp. TaxID=2045415 RepID=UPI003EB9AB07